MILHYSWNNQPCKMIRCFRGVCRHFRRVVACCIAQQLSRSTSTPLRVFCCQAPNEPFRLSVPRKPAGSSDQFFLRFCASYARVTPESSFSSFLCQTCSSRSDSALVCGRPLTSASLLTGDHPPKMTGFTRLKEAIERHRENKDINVKYKTPLTSMFICSSFA